MPDTAAKPQGKPPAAPPSLKAYRWGIALRALCATLGGYALASAFAACCAAALAAAGMLRVDAVLLATMLAFIVQALAGLWAFGCHSMRKACLGIVLPAAALLPLAWWLAQPVAGANA